MRKALLIIFILASFSGSAQLTSLVVRNDTLFNFDPSTGTYTQLTKLVPPMAGQSGKVISTNGSTYNWITPFDGVYSSLSGKPDLSVYAAIATTDSMRTNIYGALNGKQASGNYLTSYLATTSIGYTTGAGGTVTQSTSKTTGVTLNKLSGQITMNNAALAAGAEVAFTLTNSFIAATDVVIVNVQSVGTAGSYLVSVGAVSAGSCSITVSNASAGSLSQAIVLNFAVIKSVIN